MLERIQNTPLIQQYRRLDHYLLINYPRLWMIRLPYILLYLLLANLLVFGFVWLILLKRVHIENWMRMLGGIEFFLLYFWFARVKQFHPEKAFESTRPLKGILEILSYIFCIAVIISPTVTSMFFLEIRFSSGDLESLFLYHVLVLHFGYYVFIYKHVHKVYLSRAFAYLLALASALGTFWLVISFIFRVAASDSPTVTSSYDPTFLFWSGLFFLILLVVFLFAAWVYKLNRRREFVVLNIIVLPIGIQVFLYLMILNRLLGNVFYFVDQTIPFAWILFIASPVLYLWFIPLSKAFLIRWLGLPTD